jgi:selenocysteine lyase/cysteine desulfurase
MAARATDAYEAAREKVARFLHAYATDRLLELPGLRMIGTAPDKAAVLTFVVDGIAAEDIGEALDREGIAVRTGHHCAQPIVRHYGHESTVRASLALYNTRADIDALIAARQLRPRACAGGGGLEERAATRQAITPSSPRRLRSGSRDWRRGPP